MSFSHVKETLSDATLSPSVERKNGVCFAVSVVLTYLSAPVTYVGVVQATLCDRLGGSATLANLPAAFFVFGGIVPLFLSSVVPYRLEKAVATGSAVLMALSFGVVGSVLVVPISNTAKIAVVIAQSAIAGVLSVVAQVYLFQALKRGTTEKGRARALKSAYTIGPLAAVAGSLLAQGFMSSGSASTRDLHSYAALYLIGVPCLLGAATAISRMQLVEVTEESRLRPFSYLSEGLRDLFRSKSMLLLCGAYFASNAGLSVLPNLSLHLRQATGFLPEQWVGYVMALQFGFKSASGYLYGSLAETRGPRVTLQVLQVFLFLVPCWALLVRGPVYVFAFALVGAAQLSGVYFPNYCLAISSNATGARNLSLLMIISSLAGLSAAAHGVLRDLLGPSASFYFSGFIAGMAFVLVSMLPRDQFRL